MRQSGLRFVIAAALAVFSGPAYARESCDSAYLNLIADFSPRMAREAVGLRVEILGSRTSSDLDALAENQRGLEAREVLPEASIDHVLLSLVGQNPAIEREGKFVVYRGMNGIEVVEDALARSFRVRRRDPQGDGETALRRDGTPAPAGELAPTYFVSQQTGTFAQNRLANLVAMRALATALAPRLIGERAVKARRDESAAGPKSLTLAQALEKWGGPRPAILQDGYKVVIWNRETGTRIIDDPACGYFRVLKLHNGEWFPLDRFGRPVLGGSKEDLDSTHFPYGEEVALLAPDPKLDRAVAWLQSQAVPTSRSLPEIVQHEPVPVMKLLAGDKPAQGLAESRFEWNEASPEEHARVLEIAKSATAVSEKTRWVRLAIQSGSAEWLPILDKWAQAPAPTKPEGFLQKEVLTAMRLIQGKPLEKGAAQFPDFSPIVRTILTTSLRQTRVELIPELRWETLPEAEQKAILERAAKLGKTEEREKAAWIDLIARSNDPRWMPALDSWAATWGTAPLHQAAGKKLESVRRSLQALHGTDEATRLAALEKIEWSTTSPVHRAALVKRVDTKMSLKEADAYLELAARAKSREWKPALQEWRWLFDAGTDPGRLAVVEAAIAGIE